MKSFFWKINLSSSPQKVFSFWTTDEGREEFWAEKSIKDDNFFNIMFFDGSTTEVLVISEKMPKIELIFLRTILTITLNDDGNGGTDLLLNNKNIPAEDYESLSNKWISTLLNLKAVCDFGVDLRNKDNTKNYDNGYIDF